jgi:hypothetical protein
LIETNERYQEATYIPIDNSKNNTYAVILKWYLINMLHLVLTIIFGGFSVPAD